MQPYAIIDRGRGPEIAGSRITVYDVLAETRVGTTPEEMAGWYQLDVEQIHLALRYIEEHKEEVERDWAAIKARHAGESAGDPGEAGGQPREGESACRGTAAPEGSESQGEWRCAASWRTLTSRDRSRFFA